ncbi:putative lipoprotein, partial [Bacteriovorax sp. DB6_IX]
MRLRNLLTIFVILSIITSCAGMRSGRYVTLDKNYSAKSLAKL